MSNEPSGWKYNLAFGIMMILFGSAACALFSIVGVAGHHYKIYGFSLAVALVIYIMLAAVFGFMLFVYVKCEEMAAEERAANNPSRR